MISESNLVSLRIANGFRYTSIKYLCLVIFITKKFPLESNGNVFKTNEGLKLEIYINPF